MDISEEILRIIGQLEDAVEEKEWDEETAKKCGSKLENYFNNLTLKQAPPLVFVTSKIPFK